MKRVVIAAGLVAIVTACAPALARAQSGSPRNDLPQPYTTTRDWGQLPAGTKWAAVTAVEPGPGDPLSPHVWAR